MESSSYHETLYYEGSPPLSQRVTHQSSRACVNGLTFRTAALPKVLIRLYLHRRLERGHLSARYLPPRLGSREEEAIPDRDTYYLSLHLLNSPRHV